jgi:phage terminase small subunit
MSDSLPATTTPRKPLSARQQLFVDAFRGEAKGNASEAARIAGYRDTTTYPYRLLKMPEIRARLEEHLEENGITADRIMNEVADIAFADWRDFVTIRFGKDGKQVDVKMDLSSKVKSLDMLGKQFGMFRDKLDVTHSGSVGVEHRLEELSRLTDEELRLMRELQNKATAIEAEGKVK